MSRAPRPAAALALLLTALAAPVSAQPFLATDAAALASVGDPPQRRSVFHDQAEVDRDVAALLDTWRTQALSVGWTTLQLGRHIRHKVSPSRGARGLALTHVAMHDAYELALAQGLEPQWAVSAAAAQVLGYLFTTEESHFERVVQALEDRLRSPSSEAGRRAALTLGFRVGRAVIAHGEQDGSQKGWNGIQQQWYGEGRYYGPGSWVPTPPYFYFPPDEPFAPQWKTWILIDGAEFRPAPPAFGSARYLKELAEVVDTSERLTEDQQRIAKFWVDGHGTMTPPGHWNQIAIDLLARHPLPERQVFQLFLQLNLALFDTAVAVWDAKYFYWTARPITVAPMLLGRPLKPALLTPPFPSYPSGHAGFSGAAAAIIGQHFPQERAKVDAMAEEAAESRLLGGIHFRADNDDGLTLGRRIACKVMLVTQQVRCADSR